MGEHPIDGLMTTAMESIRSMVDVNTIVGDAVQASDGTVIIPVSRVSFGFAAGGGEYSMQSGGQDSSTGENKFPFAGGSGAGVTISPVAFMVVGQSSTIKLLQIERDAKLEKIFELIPEFIDKLNDMFKAAKSDKTQNGTAFAEIKTTKQQES